MLAHRARGRRQGGRDLFDVLGPDDERELATPLQAELQRVSTGRGRRHVAVASEREALVQYHQKANPVLRRAVALTTAIRDRHFELARERWPARAMKPPLRVAPCC